MDRFLEQTLALLRAGLWGKAPERDLFTPPVDWKAIYDAATEQTVLGIVTDGIELLPEQLRPGIDELEPFLADVLVVEQGNARLDRFIAEMYRRLSRNNITALLIKGQALATYYPVPKHRQAGDIDLLVPLEEYSAAKDFLCSKATEVEKEHESIYHQGMLFGSIEVEVHGAVTTLMSVSLDRKLAAFVKDMFSAGEFDTCEIGGYSVPVPPVDFNAVYILVHFLHHYWSSGLGLRQIVDWVMFLSEHRGRIDTDAVGEYIDRFGLRRIWTAFGAFAVKYLGADPAVIPFYDVRGEKKAARILGYLLRSGNFGTNHPREMKERPYLIRKLHSLWLLVIHDRLRHFVTFPLESLRFFFGAMHFGIIRLLKGE